MKKINEGGPAFPVAAVNAVHHGHPGMLLRDWFAGQAMGNIAGFCSQEEPFKTDYPRQVAEMSYAIADAMIAEREKAGAK